MVPVPEDRVLDVYALLAGPSAQAPAHESAGDDAWDQRTLEQALREVSPTVEDLARFLAEHPDEEVSTTEAADALGLPFGWNSLAGTLGAFGRYLGNRDLDFPWEVWYSPVDGRTRMRMDGRTAELVRSLPARSRRSRGR
jgi:hypothetical protein